MTSYCHKSLKKKKIGKNTQASIMYRAHAIQNKTTYSVFSSRSWFFEKRKSSSRPKTVICPQLHQTAGASLVAQMVKNLPATQETGFNPWFQKIPWRREWQPTPVFLPEKSHGQRSLVDFGPWDCKESDTTEQLTLSLCGTQRCDVAA